MCRWSLKWSCRHPSSPAAARPTPARSHHRAGYWKFRMSTSIPSARIRSAGKSVPRSASAQVLVWVESTPWTNNNRNEGR